MQELVLNNEIIDRIKMEVPELVKKLMKEDLVEVVLYGSCARGDYTEDSDIDIALITKDDRIEVQKYTSDLAAIATEFAMKYFAIVNFVCLPYKEYVEKKAGMHILKISKEKEKCCIDQEYYDALPKVRLERAKELVIESKNYWKKGYISQRTIEHFM